MLNRRTVQFVAWGTGFIEMCSGLKMSLFYGTRIRRAHIKCTVFHVQIFMKLTNNQPYFVQTSHVEFNTIRAINV